jgi:hypothetical protein
MFEIKFEDDKGEKSMVWQNSWGFTTRVVRGHSLSQGKISEIS